jgi:hypothetical protein
MLTGFCYVNSLFPYAPLPKKQTIWYCTGHRIVPGIYWYFPIMMASKNLPLTSIHDMWLAACQFSSFDRIYGLFLISVA